MYTAAKEADLGENLSYGKYKNSGLAKLWEKVLKNRGKAFVDFEPYAPSNNEPCAFVGAPVKKDGEVIGVVALQLPLGAFPLSARLQSSFRPAATALPKRSRSGTSIAAFPCPTAERCGNSVISGSGKPNNVICETEKAGLLRQLRLLW